MARGRAVVTPAPAGMVHGPDRPEVCLLRAARKGQDGVP